MDARTFEARHDAGVMPRRDVVIVRGEGARLWDEEGREYIDCVAGHGVAIVGHCNPAVVEAVTRQAGTLITCPQIFYNDQRAALLRRLASLGPPGLDRAFLCNSGTEAVEAAIKFARLCTGRPGIIATMRGFHGRTLGALSATWNKKYREPFEPLVPGFTHVPYDNLDAVKSEMGEQTAGIIVEIVQGEGGVHPGSTEYFQGLRQLCDERGALLIADEVQTGFGRTGRLFACEHHELVPDVLCLAKGIAGGVPMGAAVLGPRVQGLKPSVHGTTFGGNPLSCAAALATIDYILEQDLPGRAAEEGEWLLHRLQAVVSPCIRAVRGIGLMIGLELRERVQPYLTALMDRGVLALPAGRTVIRLLPPLVIEREELEVVACAIDEVLRL